MNYALTLLIGLGLLWAVPAGFPLTDPACPETVFQDGTVDGSIAAFQADNPVIWYGSCRFHFFCCSVTSYFFNIHKPGLIFSPGTFYFSLAPPPPSAC